MNNNKINLNHKNTWAGRYKEISFEIAHWGINEYTPNGIWNYYVHLHECLIENIDEFFLQPEVKQWSEGGRKYLTYDYYKSPLMQADWHGGITFWEQHEDPYKRIKVGCDFSHLYDEGRSYDLDTVLWECQDTIDGIIPLLKFKEKL